MEGNVNTAMEEKIYTITLADGTTLTNIRQNGDNFISDTPLDSDVFLDNCSPVIISDGENEEMHENMELVQVTTVGNEYWFVLRDMSAEELEKIRLQADIEYIAMMAGIEL